MRLDRQMDTLTAVYGEKSDGELLELADKRDGLTEMAQQALAGVMRERGLHAGAADAEDDGSAEGQDVVGEGDVLVYLFHDAFEAREAIRWMRDADIPHRMLDWHEVEPEMRVSQTGVDLGLVVARGDAKRAQMALKEKMGLFPAAEAEEDSGGEGFAVLSMFERGEGLVAAHALGSAGMTYLWRDGREAEAHLPDEETVAIEVRPEDVARATAVVEEALSGMAE